jgi:hypothetical protein
MKALTFLRRVGASQASVVRPRLDQAAAHVETSIGHIQASGFFALLLRLAVHLSALTGLKNRIAVLANWIVASIDHGRPQRAITAQQVFARKACEAQAAATVSKGEM